MPTTREVQAAKTERQRRERRYYTLDRLGSRCLVCPLRIPKALEALGMRIHPTCHPGWRR